MRNIVLISVSVLFSIVSVGQNKDELFLNNLEKFDTIYISVYHMNCDFSYQGNYFRITKSEENYKLTVTYREDYREESIDLSNKQLKIVKRLEKQYIKRKCPLSTSNDQYTWSNKEKEIQFQVNTGWGKAIMDFFDNDKTATNKSKSP